MVRLSALNILNRTVINGESLKTQDFDLGLQSADRAFLKLMVYTVFRHINQLDKIIKQLVKKKPDAELKNALYLGIAQMLYLNVPVHAAVFETVQMIKKTKFKNNSGFINGVLRNFSRRAEELKPKCLNFPDHFVKLLKKDYTVTEIEKLSSALENEPCIDISVKNNPEYWMKELKADLNEGNNIRLAENSQISLLNGYKKGEWWVQSYSAFLPVTLFTDIKNKNVADFCAAPGGKTSQMISMGASVTAFDISEKRIKTLSENLKRLNYSAEIINKDPCCHNFDKQYDAILLDAPCSGTGTLRKNPDIIIKKIDFNALRKTQVSLLKTAMKNVKAGGEIVYSTCSLMHCEGEDLIKNILETVTGFTLLREKRLFPSDKYGEGFYMALIKKDK